MSYHLAASIFIFTITMLSSAWVVSSWIRHTREINEKLKRRCGRYSKSYHQDDEVDEEPIHDDSIEVLYSDDPNVISLARYRQERF